ncbi:MAG: L,D-transpeptidase family protein [Pseudomonadota bacterium]|nr:L,D-transpeptidase family protein [Pseudomonadota bacterium]
MKMLSSLAALSTLFWATPARPDTVFLPANGDTVVGSLGVTTSEYEDTLLDIGLAYDQGYQEMRLYYYPKAKPGEPRVVITHPVSVGRQDWKTPQGATHIVAKTLNPAWYPPASIRKEHAADGDPLPKMVPPGPDNPLGRYALRLGHNGYLIHGTNKPFGIGMRVTHGCLRLYPKDIERLFGEVRVGTPVRIVNQPFKIGWLSGGLYLETHPPLDEDAAAFHDSFTQVVGQVTEANRDAQHAVDWDGLQQAVSDRKGIPVRISRATTASVEAEVSLGDAPQ